MDTGGQPEPVHPDQLKREKIPTRADVPTMYHPVGRLLMIVPLPDAERIGSIIVPDVHRAQMNEGHIIDKGPECINKGIEIGDCVVWAQNNEFRMEVDGVKFVNLSEAHVIMNIPKAELEQSMKARSETIPG